MPNAPASRGKRFPSVTNAKAWFLGWLPVTLGIVSWLATALHLFSPDEPGNVFGVFAAIAISVSIHELAHFFVGRAVGRKPWCLRIGHGEVVFDKEFESFRLILKSLPYSGAVYPWVKGSRAERFAEIFAGPFSNSVLFVVSFVLVEQWSKWDEFRSIPMQVFLANAYVLVLTAVPYYSKSGQPSDGMMLYHVVRGTPLRPRSKANS